MRPRPLYRSLTFWSGILVVTFLCWGWRDSLRQETDASWGSVFVVNAQSYIGVGRSPSHPSFGYGRSGPSGSSGLTPPPFLARGGKEWADHTGRDLKSRLESSWSLDPGFWSLFIPHWLLVTCATLLWSGLLLWRARRMKRAVDPVTEG